MEMFDKAVGEIKMSAGDKIVLKSGFELYANCGFVSINEKLEIAEGYDGGFPLAQYEEYYDPDYPGPSKEDMLELADLIIERWNKFKEKVRLIEARP